MIDRESSLNGKNVDVPLSPKRNETESMRNHEQDAYAITACLYQRTKSVDPAYARHRDENGNIPVALRTISVGRMHAPMHAGCKLLSCVQQCA